MAEPEKTIEDRVRDRAYALWEKNGRPDGRSDEYWQQARSELEDARAKGVPMGRRNANHRLPVLKRPVERVHAVPYGKRRRLV